MDEQNSQESDTLDEQIEEGAALSSENSQIMVKTHDEINASLCGEIREMLDGYVVVELETIAEMKADKHGLIHGGFIFGAADYAAMLAVNEKNVVLANSSSSFLSPVRMGDSVRFEARLKNKEGRKRFIKVKGFVLDVKVYEGEFRTIVTDNHVLNLSLLDAQESEQE